MSKRWMWMVVGMLLSSTGMALDAVGQRYVDLLTKGGAASIREAAQSIFHTGMKDTEVLDVAAEVLIQEYPSAIGNREIDAMAWVCKALGNSGNGRYSGVLKQVAEGGGHRKLTRHCAVAGKRLRNASSDGSYVPGTINLKKYQDASRSSAPARPAAAQARPAKGVISRGSFSDIVVGMSMDEVTALIGAPSNTYSHQTGKAWNPFNFQGKDVARIVALYKGQGRIIYSQDTVYSSSWRVLEIREDASETGYP